ncbi:MAG: hypothetical protein DDT26_00012 [Dehalococcoidia bacterium]|nr:hypothetical protein [Chloroflexota bacterium]
MNVNEKLRLGHVRRWHIVAVSREQTVADHSHRVGVITEEILRILGIFNWNSNTTLNAMRWAAIHDRPEIKLGDIPTPGKELIRSNSARGRDPIHLSELEAEATDLEYFELSECVSPGGDCSVAGHVVKLADTLEAINYLGIFGVGSHAHEVWRGLTFQALRQIETLNTQYQLPKSTRGRMAELYNRLLEKNAQ